MTVFNPISADDIAVDNLCIIDPWLVDPLGNKTYATSCTMVASPDDLLLTLVELSNGGVIANSSTVSFQTTAANSVVIPAGSTSKHYVLTFQITTESGAYMERTEKFTVSTAVPFVNQ